MGKWMLRDWQGPGEGIGEAGSVDRKEGDTGRERWQGGGRQCRRGKGGGDREGEMGRHGVGMGRQRGGEGARGGGFHRWI